MASNIQPRHLEIYQTQHTDINRELHRAIKMGNLDLVKCWVSQGASITTLDDCGNQSLHLACYMGAEAIARYLFEQGADLKALNRENKSALQIAKEGNHQSLVYLLSEKSKIPQEVSQEYTKEEPLLKNAILFIAPEEDLSTEIVKIKEVIQSRGSDFEPKKQSILRNQKWNADKYHQNSSIQFESSKKMLEKVCFRDNERILDIGCGDGKITAMISSYIPNGKILGIDLSLEMIQFANEKFNSPQYQNVSFQLQDGASLTFKNEFDMIFSSFALHWILNFGAFVKKVNEALKNNGEIVFTIPLGMSLPLEQATEELIKSPNWGKFFIDYEEPWRFSKVSEYEKMILNADFDITFLEVVSDKKIFDSRKSFENYVIQWYPYINFIDSELREKFFAELFDRYLEIEPCSPSGRVNFEYSRIDVIAKKQ